jgi:electron transport complex protein RnfA
MLLVAAIACWSIERFLLAPFGLDWLRILVWLLIVAALAPWPRALLHHRASITLRDPDDRDSSGALSPPLLIGNGLVLGAVVLNSQTGFGSMLARSFGIAIGFGIVLLLFTAMHDRLDGADVPAPFRGVPILLITAAMMALAFMGFAGIGQ